VLKGDGSKLQVVGFRFWQNPCCSQKLYPLWRQNLRNYCLAAAVRSWLRSFPPSRLSIVAGVKMIFCPSFYIQPKPKGSYGPNLHTIALDSGAGMLILDVVNGKMMFVEVLNNDANRKWLFGGAAVRRNR